jgi:hypothetical protein
MRSYATISEKIFCACFYTAYFFSIMTWVPIIWLIVVNIKKINLKDFIRYHAYQALLLNMIIFFLPQLLTAVTNLLLNLISFLPYTNNLILLLNQATSYVLIAYQYILQALLIYAIIWTLRGKFTYIPPISQAVNMFLR